MKIEPTNRGFMRAEFTDANGVECSIQESSAIAEQGLLWLGANTIGLKKFTLDGGWHDVPLDGPGSYLANTRMHLNQDHARALLPLLAYFAETGRLPK